MRYVAARVLAVPTLEVYTYLTGLGVVGTLQERRLMREILEKEFIVLSLSAFSGLIRYGAVMPLLFERMMVMCHTHDALVRIPTEMIEKLFEVGILLLIRSMEVVPVLALVAMAHVAEVARKVFPDQECFLFDHSQGMLVLRTRGGAVANQGAEEGGGEGGSQSVVRPVHHAGCATRGMSLLFLGEAWCQYLANKVNYFVLPSLEEKYEAENWRYGAESTVGVCTRCG